MFVDDRIKRAVEELEEGNKRKVKNIMYLGEQYQFIEYKIIIDDKEQETYWRAYIKYEETRESFCSLDEAIINALAIKNNEQTAPRFIKKILNMR